MNKFVCIHGHFYQPPRENPWLNEVEVQDSAYPHHDWNARISSECYARNAAARILDPNKKIIDIVNNYSKISFNFGPTLLSWMEKNDAETYRAILEADALSCQRFSGHGSAIAQVYNHLIMPLANSRDKRTQVIWGIKDFERRFKRKPEGMWLAETAVDLESLDIMAEFGIKFSVLAPSQAKRVRKVEDHKRWKDVSGQHIDSRMPYLCHLPSGRTITLFFYDGAISQAVAFEGLLTNGEHFAQKLLSNFDRNADPQLAHIATDGETYGHHHKFGDMALAYCLYFIESHASAELINYAAYLERFPPTHEVEIFENSSWSCVHGIERWRSNCGCSTGAHPGWNQEWRGPLRLALDWLRDELVSAYEREMPKYMRDIWDVRDAYIDVILERDLQKIEGFFDRYRVRDLSLEDKIKVLKLQEMQHNALLMYTSCGWFFDEVSRIEPVQIIKYAARAIQLGQEAGGVDLEPQFVEMLKNAKSNIPEYGDAAHIYQEFVKPSVVDLLRVGAHYAVTALFEEYLNRAHIYCYTVDCDFCDRRDAGRLRLAVGKAWVYSDITWEKVRLCFTVLHLGDHNIIWGVHRFIDDAAFNQMHTEMSELFLKSDVPGMMGLMDKHYGSHQNSLWHLFRREQQMILDKILQSTMDEIEASFRQIYDRHYSLMQAKKENQIHLPKALATIVEFILTRELSEILTGEVVDISRLETLVAELKRWAFERDKTALSFAGSQKINDLMHQFFSSPEDIGRLEVIETILRNLCSLNLDLDLWKAQNLYFSISKRMYTDKQSRAKDGDARASQWVSAFDQISHYLQVKIF